MTLYLGLMSGTSMDGIDAALLEIGPDGAMRVRAARECAWPAALQQQLRRAAEDPAHTGLEQFGRLDTAAGMQLAHAAEELLRTAAVPAAAVRAIGRAWRRCNLILSSMPNDTSGKWLFAFRGGACTTSLELRRSRQ